MFAIFGENNIKKVSGFGFTKSSLTMVIQIRVLYVPIVCSRNQPIVDPLNSA